MTTKTDTPKKSQRKPARILWHLVTNHQNMLYMLAAGMVMSPAGFRGKHYSDPLNVCPGWIPLFKTKIPADVLKCAISERKFLSPCIATFDLSNLLVPVQMLSKDRKTRKVVSAATIKRKDEIAILFRAPLPATLLRSINFRSHDDKQKFEIAANNVSNVDLSSHSVEISESLFSPNGEVRWLAVQAQDQLPLGLDDGQRPEGGKDNFPAFGQAVGGVLAMLYHTANRSDLGLAAFWLITGATCNKKDKHLLQSDPILAELPNWMEGSEISGQADTRAWLFWGVIQELVTAQMQECPQPPIDVALAYLENQLDLLREKEFRPRLERLIADMRGFLGLGGGTITELLERHKGSLSRPLLLFCLREHCNDLLEFSHPLLSDAEYVLAGILFGVRDSWLQLPKELRDPDMSAYVVFRMAEAEHRKQGDNFVMDVPPRPKPVRELFTSPSGEWNNDQKDRALELASECNWNDCIWSCIIPAEGDFPESIEPKNSQIVLQGVFKVAYEVDKAKFLRRLGQWPPIAHQIESKVRKKFVSQGIGEKTNGNGSSCV